MGSSAARSAPHSGAVGAAPRDAAASRSLGEGAAASGSRGEGAAASRSLGEGAAASRSLSEPQASRSAPSPRSLSEPQASRSAVVGRAARAWAVPVGIGIVVTALYTLYSALQWAAITVTSWDLAIFTQLVQQYATLSAPIVLVKGDGFNLLGDHFHPLLAVLAPIYAVFPHAFTLLVVQNVCFGLAAAIIAWGARSVVGPVASACFGLAFGLSWGLQGAVEVQFHEVALAVPLLAASMVALLRNRFTAAALWAAPLVFVKEDLGLTVLAIGLVLAWRSRKPAALWLCVWGVAWFFLATFVVLPMLNPNGSWQYAGSMNPIALLGDPAALFAEQKFRTIGLLLLTTAGIGLRSPIVLILLPTLAWRFLSSNHGYWGPTWHYSAVLMPIAFVAVLDGIRILRTARSVFARGWARASSWIVVAVSAMLLPILPLWSLVNGDAVAAVHESRADAAWAVLDQIPEGVTVESDLGLLAYSAERTPTFWIGNENPAPDCMLRDGLAGATPSEWGVDVLEVAAMRYPKRTYELVVATEGYELACVSPGR